MKKLEHYIETAKKHKVHKELVDRKMLLRNNQFIRRFFMTLSGIIVLTLGLSLLFNDTEEIVNDIEKSKTEMSIEAEPQTELYLDSVVHAEEKNNDDKKKQKEEEIKSIELKLIPNENAKPIRGKDSKIGHKSNVIANIAPLKMIELDMMELQRVLPEFVPEENTIVFTDYKKIKTESVFNFLKLDKLGYEIDDLPFTAISLKVFRPDIIHYGKVQHKDSINKSEGIYPFVLQTYSGKSTTTTIDFNFKNLDKEYEFLKEVYKLRKKKSEENRIDNLEGLRKASRNYSASLRIVKKKLIPVRITPFKNELDYSSIVVWFVPSQKFIDRVKNDYDIPGILNQFKSEEENGVISNFDFKESLDVESQEIDLELDLKLKEDSEITFGIYDAKGELIRHIANENLKEGSHVLNYTIDNFTSKEVTRIVAIDKNNNVIVNYYN